MTINEERKETMTRVDQWTLIKSLILDWRETRGHISFLLAIGTVLVRSSSSVVSSWLSHTNYNG